MKVLHIINTLSAGGAELHLLTLCRHLQRQGVTTTVACLREHVKGSRSLYGEFEREGIRVVRLAAEGRYDLRYITKLRSLFEKQRPDILHTHLPRADLAGVFTRLQSRPAKWVSSVHDIYDKSWSGSWTLPLFTLIWRQADQIVAISQAVKDWLVRKHSVPAEKISVIHYGIEIESFTARQTDLRRQWGLADRLIIGSIGRLEPRKGHECLIRAIAMVKTTIPNVVLAIAGHDPWGYGKELQSLIDGLGLTQHIRLVGFQSDIAAFLGAVDIFAFATRSEGFGQVVVEAMAAGKPMTVSNLPPLTEIMVHGETGLLADPENPGAFARAISCLSTNREAAQAMGARARERAQNHFTAERMTQETVAFYEGLVRGSSTMKAPAANHGYP